MEKFAQFGVEPILLLAQIINFLVLLYLLKRFLYKPVLTILKKREVKIKEGLESGVRGEELLLKASSEEKDILSKASKQANVLIEDTKNRAAKLESEALLRVKDESEVILQKAKEQIEKEKIIAEKEVEKSAVFVAIGVLEKVMPKALTRQDQLRILDSSEKLLRKVFA